MSSVKRRQTRKRLWQHTTMKWEAVRPVLQGRCIVCRIVRSVDPDGRVRRHQALDAQGPRDICPGSQKRPVTGGIPA